MIIDLTNQRFGRLMVAEHLGLRNGSRMWRCRCDCGAEKIVSGSNLRRGSTNSCGCLLRERAKEANIKHGKTSHPLHRAWRGMRQRCENPRNRSYAYYGGRGIRVCQAWRSFESFHQWATTHGWQQGLTLDRIDANGNYSPSNCRWASRAVQARNTRTNINVVIDGARVTLSEAARQFGVSFWKAREILTICRATKSSFQTAMKSLKYTKPNEE
jgi:hypothetical protein